MVQIPFIQVLKRQYIIFHKRLLTFNPLVELLSCYFISLLLILISKAAFRIFLIVYLVVLILRHYVFTLFNYDVGVFILKFFKRVLGVECGPG